MPVIAENLGVITEGVTALMDQFEFPGMAILQFAFDSDPTNDFLPHNFQSNLVAYTGTHDNDTIVGWWENTASTQDAAAIERAKQFCRTYLNLDQQRDVHWAFCRALLGSVADMAIIPLQDILGLGGSARMNIPGEGSGNWEWRYVTGQLSHNDVEKLHHLTWAYGRQPETQEATSAEASTLD